MMTLHIALAQPACRSRDPFGIAGRDGTDYHPSDHAIGKGQIREAWCYVLVAATLSIGVPLLGTGIGSLGHLVAASPAWNTVAHLGSGVARCATRSEHAQCPLRVDAVEKGLVILDEP